MLKKVYAYDALGRVSARTQTRGSSDYAYAFDAIGNRETSSEAGTALAYATNALNQYSQIAPSGEPSGKPSGEATFQSLVENPSEENSSSTVTPTYDLDENETRIRIAAPSIPANAIEFFGEHCFSLRRQGRDFRGISLFFLLCGIFFEDFVPLFERVGRETSQLRHNSFSRKE